MERREKGWGRGGVEGESRQTKLHKRRSDTHITPRTLRNKLLRLAVACAPSVAGGIGKPHGTHAAPLHTPQDPGRAPHCTCEGCNEKKKAPLGERRVARHWTLQVKGGGGGREKLNTRVCEGWGLGGDCDQVHTQGGRPPHSHRTHPTHSHTARTTCHTHTRTHVGKGGEEGTQRCSGSPGTCRGNTHRTPVPNALTPPAASATPHNPYLFATKDPPVHPLHKG